MPPAQAGEAGEVAVERDPFAFGFDGQSREICILYQVSCRASARTEVREDVPMTRTGSHKHGVWPVVKGLAELQRALERRRRMENLRMRNDAHKATKDD